MTRKEQIEQASVEYQLQKKPVAISGAEWADVAYRMNINKDFVAGAEWADENPPEGFFLRIKLEREELIDRAAEWLAEQKEIIGVSFTEDFFERFHKAMEK